METVRTFLESCRLGKKQTRRNLTVFPLLCPETFVPDYLVLEEVLSEKSIEIRFPLSAKTTNRILKPGSDSSAFPDAGKVFIDHRRRWAARRQAFPDPRTIGPMRPKERTCAATSFPGNGEFYGASRRPKTDAPWMRSRP